VNTHIYEGLSEPIIGDITLEESVLYIKLDYIVNIRTIKDSSEGIVSHDLVTYYI
jgi:hypothetical protein